MGQKDTCTNMFIEDIEKCYRAFYIYDFKFYWGRTKMCTKFAESTDWQNSIEDGQKCAQKLAESADWQNSIEDGQKCAQKIAKSADWQEDSQTWLCYRHYYI